MSENTKIEWTDHTFNPWWGCTKVSPGCDHCYAETLDHRTGGAHWGAGAERRRTGVKNWNDPVRWNAKADAFLAEHGRRQRVFCASMADVFDNQVPDQWREDLFELILATPNLDWLLLTKRIGNVGNMLPVPFDFDKHYPNVWLGATIVDQEEANRDIPKLLAVSAAKCFLSMEPLLGPVNLTRLPVGGGWYDVLGGWRDVKHWFPGFENQIDWVIVGGESGPGARPMHPDWARSLRDQCASAGVPFLFKQWGEWTPGENVKSSNGAVKTAKLFSGGWSFSKEELSDSGGHVDDEPDLYRIGKKEAGRFLDGRNWDGVPT